MVRKTIVRVSRDLQAGISGESFTDGIAQMGNAIAGTGHRGWIDPFNLFDGAGHPGGKHG